MQLIVRVVVEGRVATDVVVEVEPEHSVAELTGALCRHVQVVADSTAITVHRTGELLDPAVPVAGSDLISGDVLILGPPSRRRARREPPTRAVAIDVLSGPGSGQSLMMVPGHYRIGRDRSSDLVIDDASVSRHHAELTVDSAWTVTLSNTAGAANGVTINDRRLEVGEASTIDLDDVIALGGSRLTLRAVDGSPAQRRDRLGQIEFHRTPHRPPASSRGDVVVVGPIPERPPQRQLRVLAMMAPMAGGLAMFAISRHPQFLALTAVSPLMMAATFLEDRRSGRVAFRRQVTQFDAAVPQHRAHLEHLRQCERIERWRAAPDLAALARRAELRTIDLWARGRDSLDFLSLRVGIGCSGVRHTIELADGGDEGLRARLVAALAGLETIENVPIVVELGAHPVMAVCGDRRLVDGVVRSLVAQAAILHSPEDLTVVAAVSVDRGLGWLRWLPHVRSAGSPIPGNLVTCDRAQMACLLERLLDVTDRRAAEYRSDAAASKWPHLLVVLDADLEPDAAGVSRLLDRAHRSGISVIWLAPAVAGVPRQAQHVLETSRGEADEMTGVLWSTRVDVEPQACEVEHLGARRADAVARALAPLRDASTASLWSAIPRVAPVLDVLAISSPSSRVIVESWTARRCDLSFSIGVGAGGPLVIDLIEHGPHALVGGTSGAGKSELLQAIVVGLAVRHPPTRVNFLFVDYKGGAATNVFQRLPHTVGYVTNLSPELALRALVSLRAEVDRRQRLLEGRASDLAELREVAPDEAPPSLVIIVDEFATLTQQVPEFVTGVIDIAQRGRSLGIHLVLSTQRPSAVNENIAANTNLRISLRTLSRAESSAILDSPVAAEIPVPLRGRAFARIGPHQLVEFQSSFVSATSGRGDARTVTVADLTGSDASSPNASSGGGLGDVDGPTQRELLLDAIEHANRVLGLPPARRPWHDVLPDAVTLDDLIPSVTAPTHDPGRFVTIGMLDQPELQQQRPAVVDLEQGGGWLIVGSGGSGKTTLLRTVAASISVTASSGDVEVLGFDFGSRQLAGIGALPDVVDVVGGDDLEAVTRHISMLDIELARRRRLLADAQAEDLTAYNVQCRPLPRIVVLIDGIGSMVATLGNLGGRLGAGSTGSAAFDQWNERVQRIVIDGRQVGIHTVMTADRQHGVPQRILSAVSNRTVLRLADANAYVDHGVAASLARSIDLPPGRGLMNGRVLVQVASVSADPSGKAQADQIADLAAGRRPTPSVLRSSPLPAAISVTELDRSCQHGEVIVGVADITGAPVAVDLRTSHLTVCGPRQSGRSTALATLATALQTDHDVFLASASQPDGSLATLATAADRRAVGGDAVVAMLQRLLEPASADSATSDHPAPRVLVVDDADRLDAPALAPWWERVVAHGGVRVVAAVSTRSMTGYGASSPLVAWLRRWEQLLVLRPDDPAEFFSITNVRLDLRPGSELPPGRGVVLRGRQSTLIQVAQPSPGDHFCSESPYALAGCLVTRR